MARMTRLVGSVATVVVVAVAATAAVGIATDAPSPQPPPAAAAPVVVGTGDLGTQIETLQLRLKNVPSDGEGWATLGVTYVEQARVTGDPGFYAKAEEALKRSLAIDSKENFLAFGGQAALAAGRHDFSEALSWAKRGLAVNPYNSSLYGALADAQTQLGQYAAAAKSVQRMVDLRPGTPSLARASYVAELRGDVKRARVAMTEARSAAGTRADRAFAEYYLGELAFNSGDAAAALSHYEAAIAADPDFAAGYEGRAKALGAAGKADEAVASYAAAIERVPDPAYVLAYADFLRSVDRDDDAQVQYDVFEAQLRLFEANGVQPEADAALYYADQGNATKALEIASAAVSERSFVDLHDAHAWALHAAGRNDEALAASRKALATGMRNALFYFHRGMIERALGDDRAARTSLDTALRINPNFHPLHAATARATLEKLGDAA